MRSINQAGLDIIKQFEGLRLTAYLDQNSLSTIGYGHRITSHDEIGETITEAQADSFLLNDLETAEDAVTNLVQSELNDNQFSALVSFVYNIGQGTFEGSTMCKLLNMGNYGAASNEFPKWCHAAGQISHGLLARREAEQALFNSTEDNSTGIMAY
jgi:lysozyme